MITLACLTCRLAIRTTAKTDETVELDFLVGMKSEWYPDRYPCPSPECLGLMTLTDTIASEELKNLELYDLTPQEAFQALNGCGLPQERGCTKEAVIEAMTGQEVTSIEVFTVPNTRSSILKSIQLSNGYRIYLGAGPAGATVYRIAPPRSYVKELANG